MLRKVGGSSGVSDKVSRVDMAAGLLVMGMDKVAVEMSASAARSCAQSDGCLVGVAGGMTALM